MDLLKNVTVKRMIGFQNVEIDHIAFDSRDVKKNTLFICLSGGAKDGREFLSDAVRSGAVAVVADRDISFDIPLLIVENARTALSIIAGNYYGNPADRIKIVTVVGTNGKTSTAEILSEIFLYAGRKVGVIGTLGYKLGKTRIAGNLTTPDPIELHRVLSEYLKEGIEYVFLEASAHAIYYDKLAGIHAKATVFTNITQDHLDFFKTMHEYARTKLSYFTISNTALAVINSDDPYGRTLIASHKVPTISYGIDNPADVFAIDITEGNGLSFTVNAFDRIARIETPLRGRFNVSNVMAAISVAMYLGCDLPLIAKALESIPTVPGRYQAQEINGRNVIVDFAHTPDGLENLLGGLHIERKGKILTVFGCGGNRDKSKRPLMGAIAAKYSDFVIVTDDNPRFEEEMSIAKEIVAGMPEDTHCEIILDREKAIQRAFSLSNEGDVVVIAGKGHEEYIEKQGRKIPYSDGEVLQKLIR